MRDLVHELVHFLNYHSILYIVAGVAVFVVVWWFAEYRLYRHKRAYKITNLIMLAVSVFLILAITLIYRTKPVDSISLIPFGLLFRSFENSVIFVSIVMNIILFMPFAMFACSVFRCTSKKAIILVIISGALLSIAVEALQFLLSIGLSDIDDVICNTLGTAAGCGIYHLHNRYMKNKNIQ